MQYFPYTAFVVACRHGVEVMEEGEKSKKEASGVGRDPCSLE